MKRILKELQAEIPTLSVEEIEYTSSEGSKLSLENGIQYPPAVFLNNTLIGKGKIDVDTMTERIRKAQGP